MHAFWSRRKVDVECVIYSIDESVEGWGVLLAIGTRYFDMSSVAGVHCVGCWLVGGGDLLGTNRARFLGQTGGCFTYAARHLRSRAGGWEAVGH